MCLHSGGLYTLQTVPKRHGKCPISEIQSSLAVSSSSVNYTIDLIANDGVQWLRLHPHNLPSVPLIPYTKGNSNIDIIEKQEIYNVGKLVTSAKGSGSDDAVIKTHGGIP